MVGPRAAAARHPTVTRSNTAQVRPEPAVDGFKKGIAAAIKERDVAKLVESAMGQSKKLAGGALHPSVPSGDHLTRRAEVERPAVPVHDRAARTLDHRHQRRPHAAE